MEMSQAIQTVPTTIASDQQKINNYIIHTEYDKDNKSGKLFINDERVVDRVLYDETKYLQKLFIDGNIVGDNIMYDQLYLKASTYLLNLINGTFKSGKNSTINNYSAYLIPLYNQSNTTVINGGKEINTSIDLSNVHTYLAEYTTKSLYDSIDIRTLICNDIDKLLTKIINNLYNNFNFYYITYKNSQVAVVKFPKNNSLIKVRVIYQLIEDISTEEEETRYVSDLIFYYDSSKSYQFIDINDLFSIELSSTNNKLRVLKSWKVYKYYIRSINLNFLNNGK